MGINTWILYNRKKKKEETLIKNLLKIERSL